MGPRRDLFRSGVSKGVVDGSYVGCIIKETGGGVLKDFSCFVVVRDRKCQIWKG